MRAWMALGLLMILTGFALVVAGSRGSPGISTGGFILIGPIPIVFGSGKYGSDLALVSVAAGLVVIAVLYVMVSRSRNLTREGSRETDK